jgi:hypothetical protein
MLEKQQKNKKGKKVHAVFNQVGMGVAIIDFRVCLPLVKCQNLMFLGFIDKLMYGFSSTGVTIYCYFGLKFNDNTFTLNRIVMISKSV